MEIEYKSYCELVITSDTVSPDAISGITGIKANRSFQKDTSFTSKTSGSKGIRRNNLWAIKSKDIITEEDDILMHIDYFKKLFEDKIEGIKKLKKESQTEICFWIWIESKEVGIGLDIPESELNFINSICSRLHFSFIGGCDKHKRSYESND